MSLAENEELKLGGKYVACGMKGGMERKGGHLHKIQESTQVSRVGGGNRKEEIVLMRLRLGRCALNKSLKTCREAPDRLV